MIGHHDCGKQVDSYSAFPQTVIQDDIACFLGWDQRASGAESNEQRCVGFLKVREAATILILQGDGILVGMELWEAGIVASPLLCNFISFDISCL